MNTWIDNMGTGTTYCEGTYDEVTKTFNYTGKAIDPPTGLEKDFKETIKIIDDNNFVLEMFMTDNGKETKSMEINYSKK